MQAYMQAERGTNFSEVTPSRSSENTLRSSLIFSLRRNKCPYRDPFQFGGTVHATLSQLSMSVSI